MKKTRAFSRFLAALVGGATLGIAALGSADTQEPIRLTAADRVVESVADAKLRLLLVEVLERNPTIARLGAEAAAAAQRAPQVKALPDPKASVTWFLMPPQTRVGPRNASVSVVQALPWFGALKLDEKAALWVAAAAEARLDAARLEIVTEVRTAYSELQFLDLETILTGDDRATLEHYAELALARYAAGFGLDQDVVKLQAEITRADTHLLEIAVRRAEIVARLNALRDRPPASPIDAGEVRGDGPGVLDREGLRLRALSTRPELAAAAAQVEAAAARVERTKKAYGPDLMFGLSYGFVGRREDEAGRLNPPEGNGEDDLGLTAGISIPLWRSKLRAGVEEGVAERLAADEHVREITVAIDRDLGDLLQRVPLLDRQVRLYDEVLIVQARRSLESAESAYAAGTVGALDLLDAERVLLQVRVAAARARTDLAVALARLEGVIAGPLTDGDGETQS